LANEKEQPLATDPCGEAWLYPDVDADSIPPGRRADNRLGDTDRRRGMDGDALVTSITVNSSVELEAQWDLPETIERGVVLCHPHPLHRGTMNVPLLEAIAADLVNRSVAVLRFNFRGVGRSTGVHDGGLAEIDDVAAAVAHAGETYPDLEFGVAGWSFGATAALRWHARDRSDHNYVGIAPGIGPNASQRVPEPESLRPAHRTFIIGDRDQLVPTAAVIDYAERARATLHVLKGSDHFFYFREQKVACLLAAGLGIAVPADQIRSACE
jgi:alpha/beta superfamily hydrolase